MTSDDNNIHDKASHRKVVQQTWSSRTLPFYPHITLQRMTTINDAINKCKAGNFVPFLQDLSKTIFTGQEEVSDVAKQLQSMELAVEDWMDDFYNNLNEDEKTKYNALSSLVMRKAALKAFQNILDTSLNVGGTGSVFQFNASAPVCVIIFAWKLVLG